VKRLADQTLYELLEVPPDASAEQIQAAYDRARALYGPGSLVTYTLMEPDEAAMLEARIEDARTTLLDPERRARYDEALRQPREARAAANGGTAPVVAVPPPVIPAAPEPPPLPAAGPPHEPARPAIPLGEPVELRVEDEADAEDELEDELEAEAEPLAPEPPPGPAPILLSRAISPDEGAPPVAAPPEPPAAAEPPEPPPAPPAAPAPAAAAPAHPSPPVVTPLPAPPLPDAWTGDALRQVRESRGLSVTQISEKTKVTRHHIENIEADRFTALPAQVYLRGILLALARELRLDGQKVARSYIERIGAAGATAAAAKPR